MINDLFEKQKRYLNSFFDNTDKKKTQEIIEVLKKCRGNIIFTGVGKSGLIAKKIAFTMISTGTKAFFLSPTDALHGDIGILSKEDVLICISKSGRTKEILKIIPFIKRRGVKIISFVSDNNSKIAKMSDHFICLFVEKEICPFNLSPTTSSIIQLIFGEILSVALMNEKKFSIQEYEKNHPAGDIGKKLTLVKEVMIKDLPLCFLTDSLVDVITILSSKKCGCLLIVDNNKVLKGIFTDGDLRRAIEKDKKGFLYQKMEKLMVPNFKWIKEDNFIKDAILEMERAKKLVSVLPVLDEKKRVIGIIRMHDIVQMDYF